MKRADKIEDRTTVLHLTMQFKDEGKADYTAFGQVFKVFFLPNNVL